MTPYTLADTAGLLTPSMVVYPKIIAANIRAAIALAGGEHRLRPHAKTHKTVEIAQMLMFEGVTKHKCATIAEAEMLAMAGVTDVLIAYPLVGPNITRLAKLRAQYPGTKFASLVDHPKHVEFLAAIPGAEFVLDLDVGQHRTGVPLEQAAELYKLAAMKNLTPGGLQAYDGHNHAAAREDRESLVRTWLQPVLNLRTTLQSQGFAVPKIIVGGTPSFPVFAALADIADLECSPGTFVLHDHTYNSKYADLGGFAPAAVMITRVVSKPTSTRLTLDLGSKSVAADPPLANRVRLLNVPEYTVAGQNEEHLIIEMPEASKYEPGDLIYALPGHVCPSVALHKELYVAEEGKVVGTWKVLARDRVLSV